MSNERCPNRKAVQFSLRNIFGVLLVACFLTFFFQSLPHAVAVSPAVGLLLITGAFLIKLEDTDPITHSCAFAFGVLLSGLPFSLLLLAFSVADAHEIAENVFVGTSILSILALIPFLSVLQLAKNYTLPRDSVPAKCASVAGGVVIGLILIPCGNTIGIIGISLLILIVPVLVAVTVIFLFPDRRPAAKRTEIHVAKSDTDGHVA
jgi:hypothetical protein